MGLLKKLKRTFSTAPYSADYLKKVKLAGTKINIKK